MLKIKYTCEYDFIKAGNLHKKAERLIREHRKHVFDDNEKTAERHGKAIDRIKELMSYWYELQPNTQRFYLSHKSNKTLKK